MLEMDVLLAQEAWATRLARALVLDPDDADEVMQQTRLAWWKRPPGDPDRARSWLGIVVRNMARNHRRGQLRRQQHLPEPALSAPAVPSPEMLLERLEVHRALAEAVLGLSEPYRQVVLLRYYEGLSAAEIARKLQVPGGTIRWRLKTALEQLRVAFDARHGERRVWMAAFGPLVARADRRANRPDPGGGSPLPPANLPASSTTGTTLLPVLVATITIAGVMGLGLWRRRPPAVGEPGGSASPGLSLHGAAALARPPRLAASSSTGGAESAPPAEEGVEVPAWIRLELASPVAVAGRVVAAGAPVAGARLRLSSAALPSDRHIDRHTVSGRNGAFAFAPQPATSWYLTVTAPGLEPSIQSLDLRQPRPRSRPGGQPVEALVVDLRPCRAFARGQIRDAGGGALASARVRLAAPGTNGGVEVPVDGEGRYQICLPTAFRPGTHALVAAADGYATVETSAPADNGTVDFVLEPQALVAGRAVRDSDGEPLARANVVVYPVGSAQASHPPIGSTQPVQLGTTTDDQGRFEIRGLSAGRYQLSLGHDEIASADAQVVSIKAGAAMRGIELRLRPLAIVEGRVSRGGSPAAFIELAFKRRLGSDTSNDHIGWTTSTEDGRFRVRVEAGAVVDRILSSDAAPGGRWTPALAPARLVVDRPRLVGIQIELPPDSTADELARAVTPPGAAAPRPQTSREALFGDQVRVLGYDLSGERVARGGKLEVTVHFQALSDLAGWQLFTHVEGPGGFRNLDHTPVRGAYPVQRWRPGETIRDTFTLNVNESWPPGAYRCLLGFWGGGSGAGLRLPVSPRAQQDGEDRWLAFAFTVQ
jgi:RNA polymerase sigma factor (sigma-70 family)